jgi:hypothetical protein
MPATPPTIEIRPVVLRPVASLVPYARNARTHSPEQVAQIAASIREFGWTNPVLVDEHGGIIAGHGRVLAAQHLGMVEAPCIELHGLTDAQKRAYVLADNQLALNSGWDDALLAQEIDAIKGLDFDLSVVGFSTAELDALIASLPTGSTDTADEPAPAPAAPPLDFARNGLAARFGIVPFTVLNAREGWWQDRKRAWLAVGIQSELGRGGGVTWGVSPSGQATRPPGTRKAPSGQ